MHLAVLHSAPLWIYFALKACLNDHSANDSGKILTSISSVSHIFVFALKSCLVAFFIWSSTGDTKFYCANINRP